MRTFKTFTYFSLVFLLFISTNSFSQKRKKMNWLEEKNSYTARWRLGVGFHVGEPTGAHIQLYRLSGICTGDFSITKKISVNASISKEGYLFPKLIENNADAWKAGGSRFGLDVKFYFPIMLNPYIGVGIESGTRFFNNASDISTDLVGRIGIEQKLFGFKLSNSSSMNTTIFLDAKYNYCFEPKFSFFSPNIGLRFHFL